MGTRYEVTIVDPPARLEKSDLSSLVKGTLAEVVSTMSTYEPESELSHLNKRPNGHWIDTSPALTEVLGLAKRIHILTNGAFDPTVGPLVELWGFSSSPPPRHIPDSDLLKRIRARVGAQHLELDENRSSVRKHQAGLKLDLNAIAKGYAVDRVVERLTSVGAKRYLVNVGGELKVAGRAPRGAPWRIGIQRPANGLESQHIILRLMGGSVATSGDYRNFHIIDGQKLSHIIDPATGRPIQHKLASVTVIHARAAVADGLATGLFVLGPERGFELARKHHLPAYFIFRDDEGWRSRATPALSPFLSRYGGHAGAVIVP